MANYVVSDTNLTAVANAIRTKGGTSAQLEFPDDFVSAIGDIQTGGGVTVEPLSVTQNGTYTAESGKAYSPVSVSVSGGGGVDTLDAMNNNTLTEIALTGTGTKAYLCYSCSSLQKVDCASTIGFINSNAFGNCSSLNVLIIRKTDAMASLTNKNAFTGTPFASGGSGGTLYVPNNLTSTYRYGENWNTVFNGNANNQIKAIEGSAYE